jgi:hypothetical protein
MGTIAPIAPTAKAEVRTAAAIITAEEKENAAFNAKASDRKETRGVSEVMAVMKTWNSAAARAETATKLLMIRTSRPCSDAVEYFVVPFINS